MTEWQNYALKRANFNATSDPGDQLAHLFWAWANSQDIPIFSFRVGGYATNEEFDQILLMIKDLGFKCAWKYVSDDTINLAFIRANGVIRIDREDGYHGITVEDSQELISLRESFSQLTQKRMIQKEGSVFCLLRDSDGSINLEHVGIAGSKLEEANYSDNVIKAFRHVMKDVGADEPCGRLTIIDGPPGTGKTYLVRSLLEQAEHCTFVIIPPSMMAGLTSPDLMPVLLQETEYKESKIVFVMEDADDCLSPRMSDNIQSIGVLLNLADGILGKLLDVRIVATTNAKGVDLDEAVKRVGRLCRRIEVGALDSMKAKEIFQRLAPAAPVPEFKKSTILAEIYNKVLLYKNSEVEQSTSTEEQIGFKKS